MENPAASIRIHNWADVCESGASNSAAPSFDPPFEDDTYIFSYTSGTTGDPKGVKLTHKNILAATRCVLPRMNTSAGDTVVSYLPYTHSFEQILFAFAIFANLRIGFYSGDPLRLVEDCSKLKPHIFPSVPRLYNRIYAKL